MNELEIQVMDECGEVVHGLEEGDLQIVPRNVNQASLSVSGMETCADGRVVVSLCVAEGTVGDVMVSVWAFGTLISHPPLRLQESMVCECRAECECVCHCLAYVCAKPVLGAVPVPVTISRMCLWCCIHQCGACHGVVCVVGCCVGGSRDQRQGVEA